MRILVAPSDVGCETIEEARALEAEEVLRRLAGKDGFALCSLEGSVVERSAPYNGIALAVLVGGVDGTIIGIPEGGGEP